MCRPQKGVMLPGDRDIPHPLPLQAGGHDTCSLWPVVCAIEDVDASQSALLPGQTSIRAPIGSCSARTTAVVIRERPSWNTARNRTAEM